jgi:hypothetical protein
MCMTTTDDRSANAAFVATERDIWIVAALMVQEFGGRALIEASVRADKALSESDIERLWRRVIRAISALTETETEIIH